MAKRAWSELASVAPWETEEWAALAAHASAGRPHLRDLLQDAGRCSVMQAEVDGILLDYSRQPVFSAVCQLAAGADPTLRSLVRRLSANPFRLRGHNSADLTTQLGAAPREGGAVAQQARTRETRQMRLLLLLTLTLNLTICDRDRGTGGLAS